MLLILGLPFENLWPEEMVLTPNCTLESLRQIVK